MQHVRVIVAPAPIVTPDLVPGGHAGDDAAVTRLIASVQEQIDGPGGWLGRALGPQTLELTRPCFSRTMRLPYLPIIDVLSVKWLDADGVEQTVDDVDYRLIGDRLQMMALPPSGLGDFPDSVRIQYRAGYDGGTTGAVPARAVQAIILTVQHLLSIGERNLFLRSDEVEGVGTKTYTVSESAAELIERTTRRLLSTLWMPRL